MIATSQIKEHMRVLGSDGAPVGTVDHMEGEDRIKLTRSDSLDGMHHFIPLDWVDHVDTHVHLSMAADEAMQAWDDEGDGMELEEEGARTAMSDEEASDPGSATRKKDEWVSERK